MADLIDEWPIEPDEIGEALAALAGAFAHGSLQPAPRGIPNLRRFQGAQAAVTLDWLRRLPA